MCFSCQYKACYYSARKPLSPADCPVVVLKWLVPGSSRTLRSDSCIGFWLQRETQTTSCNRLCAVYLWSWRLLYFSYALQVFVDFVACACATSKDVLFQKSLSTEGEAFGRQLDPKEKQSPWNVCSVWAFFLCQVSALLLAGWQN